MNEILAEIELAIVSQGLDWKFLTDDRQAVVNRFLNLLSVDSNSLIPWEHTRLYKAIYQYDENWNDIIEDVLSQFSGSVYLIVTGMESVDDWLVYSGSSNHVVCLLEEVQFVEFAVVRDDWKRIMFDTDHNQIICVSPLL